jgi:competence protein ComEA
VGAAVLIGMICLGSRLSEWTLRVRPAPADSTRTLLPTDSIRPAPTPRIHPAPVSPPSFATDPLRFLSRAPADSLDLLPGIGPVLAARIVEARRARGGFSSWEQVDAVKGVGPTLIARWRALSTRQ